MLEKKPDAKNNTNLFTNEELVELRSLINSYPSKEQAFINKVFESFIAAAEKNYENIIILFDIDETIAYFDINAHKTIVRPALPSLIKLIEINASKMQKKVSFGILSTRNLTETTNLISGASIFEKFDLKHSYSTNNNELTSQDIKTIAELLSDQNIMSELSIGELNKLTLLAEISKKETASLIISVDDWPFEQYIANPSCNVMGVYIDKNSDTR